MIIDAGQKKIGAQYCTKCDFVYSEDPSEQRAHDIRHARALGFIDFKGWKRETKVDCPELDGRIVIVKYRDANNHWDKVNISQNFDYPESYYKLCWREYPILYTFSYCKGRDGVGDG